MSYFKKISQKYYILDDQYNVAMFIEKDVMDEDTLITANTDHNVYDTYIIIQRRRDEVRCKDKGLLHRR